ncbi:hypothetical protein [Haloarchaeobius sp. HME9146]|uniref:hypothetical protein n=1 Tax=Haloarchaeobius sp. HME9146 TaxID=2978732 RepID=UPI0021BEA717|nr:hypothetical protein [Haloarchaeobius sp. HME9146]MCT9098236.1 hypothetical protein [Haloarchaeobius sp. HME9146]
MPDDNRFAGLSEVVEGDEAETEDSTEPEPEPEPSVEETASVEDTESEPEPPESEAEDGDSREADADTDESDDEEAEDTDPAAFPFDATKKKTVYVREQTIEGLEDAQALVDAQLRTEHDVRSLTGREFYDAVFRVAASDTDALIDEIIDAREE